MKSEVLYPGAFPMVRIELAEGEHIKAESGAMVACSPTIDIESKMEGGFLGALSRKFLTGEKFFFQTLRASRGAGEVLLAPTVPGEIIILELDGVNEYMVQKDGFLAGADGVTIEQPDAKYESRIAGRRGVLHPQNEREGDVPAEQLRCRSQDRVETGSGIYRGQ